MDEDLAFCLDHFIDDQIDLIDQKIEQIKREAAEKCRKLEQEKLAANRKKPPPKNKGTHNEDKALVDRFIRDLRHDEAKLNCKHTIVDDPVCIATLRAHFSTKVNASAHYLSRIRNLASQSPRANKFIGSCKELISYCHQKETFETNFQELCRVLADSDKETVVQNTQQLWKDTYGDSINDINTRNKKLHPVINENGFAVLSRRSRVIESAKQLINARKIIAPESQKGVIVRKFVDRLIILDEEDRDKINPEELIEQLINSLIDQIIDYTNKWLSKRDEIRNRIEPPDPCMFFLNEI